MTGGREDAPDSPFDRKRRAHGLPRDVANGPGRIRAEGYRKGVFAQFHQTVEQSLYYLSWVDIGKVSIFRNCPGQMQKWLSSTISGDGEI